MFLGIPSFLSPFSVCQSGYTDLHPQDVYGEGAGSCRTKTPLWKIEGNCWREEILRPVPENTEDRDKKELHSNPCKSITSVNFWENLTGTFLRGQHQTQVLWSVTILFHVWHLCTATKVIHKTSYLEAQRLFFLRRQYPELQKLLAGYGKRSYLISALEFDWRLLYYLKYLQKKIKQDSSLSAVH